MVLKLVCLSVPRKGWILVMLYTNIQSSVFCTMTESTTGGCRYITPQNKDLVQSWGFIPSTRHLLNQLLHHSKHHGKPHTDFCGSLCTISFSQRWGHQLYMKDQVSVFSTIRLRDIISKPRASTFTTQLAFLYFQRHSDQKK